LRTILIPDRLAHVKRDPSNEPGMPPTSLAVMKKGARGTVAEVKDDAQSLGDESHSTISRRLLELGFVPGEALEVIAAVWPGGDPIAVRLGGTTFALRRREARSVLVAVDCA
jgi:ferrous iron transport protein A